MDSLTQSVTREIRAEMARQDLNQQKLARLLVWTPAYLSRRLLLEVAWSLDDLEEVSNALNVSVVQLLWPRAAPRADQIPA
jgi:hypothetical protein